MKSKFPKAKYAPSKERPKNPAAPAAQTSTDKETLTWSFSRIDRDGEFCYSHDYHGDGFLRDVYEAHVNYSSMTWQEIKTATHGGNGKSNNHFIAYTDLTDAGKKRFDALKIDEYEDSVFSLRLTGPKRLIGIREGRIFHVVWYDPDHRFAAMRKK